MLAYYASFAPPEAPAAPTAHSGTQDIDQILLEQHEASSILRALYQFHKARQSKISMSFICRSAGIPSKGYLALVMNGQRRLHMKYWDGILQTFKLDALQRNFVLKVFEGERLTCPYVRALHWQQIAALRERLRLRA